MTATCTFPVIARRDIDALLACVAALATMIIANRLAFPDHPDYLGHFSAGAGATMAFVVAVLVASWSWSR